MNKAEEWECIMKFREFLINTSYMVDDTYVMFIDTMKFTDDGNIMKLRKRIYNHDEEMDGEYEFDLMDELDNILYDGMKKSCNK